MLAALKRPVVALFAILLSIPAAERATFLLAAEPVAIPLPEHPRPDWQRKHWHNLNGLWQFQFDTDGSGESQGWNKGSPARQPSDPRAVPLGIRSSPAFPTRRRSRWYARTIEVPAGWQGQRVFLVVGASDWHTTAWLDGMKLGEHQGGYTPFEFELTPHVRPGSDAAPDAPRRTTRTARSSSKASRATATRAASGRRRTSRRAARRRCDAVHFTPDIDAQQGDGGGAAARAGAQDLTLRLAFTDGRRGGRWSSRDPARRHGVTFDVAIPEPRLWSLEDPFLYEVEASLDGAGLARTQSRTYFGMRKISVVNLPGTDHPLRRRSTASPSTCSSRSTRPTTRRLLHVSRATSSCGDEILRARQIGLNGLREHVKIEIAAQALLGRPARRAHHGRRAELVGRADARDAAGRSSTRCAG